MDFPQALPCDLTFANAKPPERWAGSGFPQCHRESCSPRDERSSDSQARVSRLRMQLDIVGRSGSGFKSDGLTDDIGHRLGLCFSDRLRRGRPPRLVMQKFVRQFVRGHRSMFSGVQIRKQGNLPAFGNAARGMNRFGVFEPDAEREGRGGEFLAVMPGIALDSRDRWQRLAAKLQPMDTPFRRFHADDRLLAFLESI